LGAGIPVVARGGDVDIFGVEADGYSENETRKRKLTHGDVVLSSLSRTRISHTERFERTILCPNLLSTNMIDVTERGEFE